ncbi:hypothetical protein CRUP_026939, partial [Coryphaenoides rupestris]
MSSPDDVAVGHHDEQHLRQPWAWMISMTMEGSSSVDTSPSSPVCSRTTFRRIRLMILPERFSVMTTRWQENAEMQAEGHAECVFDLRCAESMSADVDDVIHAPGVHQGAATLPHHVVEPVPRLVVNGLAHCTDRRQETGDRKSGRPEVMEAGSRYWETVQRLGITQFYGAPTALRLLLKYDESWVTRYDRSSLRTLGS